MNAVSKLNICISFLFVLSIADTHREYTWVRLQLKNNTQIWQTVMQIKNRPDHVASRHSNCTLSKIKLTLRYGLHVFLPYFLPSDMWSRFSGKLCCCKWTEYILWILISIFKYSQQCRKCILQSIDGECSNKCATLTSANATCIVQSRICCAAAGGGLLSLSIFLVDFPVRQSVHPHFVAGHFVCHPPCGQLLVDPFGRK